MCHTARISMRSAPESVTAARRWAADELAAMYAQPGRAADDAALVVSELLTNSVRADARRVSLAVEVHHERLRLEASDDAVGVPAMVPAGPTDIHGRGLHIVDAIAGNWGVRVEPLGKTVWAELTMPVDAVAGFDCAG